MNRSSYIVLEPLRPNPSSPGALNPRVQRTEWTPEPASNASIRSTWRDAVGEPLTDARIRYYALQGRYGEVMLKAERDRLENIRLRRERAREI